MKLKHKIYEIADVQGNKDITLEDEKEVRIVINDVITDLLLTDAFYKVYYDTGEIEAFGLLQYASNANGTIIEDGNLLFDGKKIHLYIPEKDAHIFITKVRNPAIIAPPVSVPIPYITGISKFLQAEKAEEIYGSDLNDEEIAAIVAQREFDLANQPPVEEVLETAEDGTEIPVAEEGVTAVEEGAGTTEGGEGEAGAETGTTTEENNTENTETTEAQETPAEVPVEEPVVESPTEPVVETSTEPVVAETPVVEVETPVVETPVVEVPAPVVETPVPVVETPVVVEAPAPVVVEAPPAPVVVEAPPVETTPVVEPAKDTEREELTLNSKDYQDARRYFGKKGFEEHIEGAYHFFYGDPIEEEDIYPFVLANRGKGIWEELDGAISEDTDKTVEFEFKDYADGGRVGKYVLKLNKETGDVSVGQK